MGFKNLFVAPSTQSFLEEARKMRGYSLFDLIHGYIYARWPYLYIGIGVGTHPLTKWLAPFGGWINKLITKQKPDESNEAQIGFADTYHGKTVPLATAKQLVLINEPIQIPDLEQIIPYQRARSLIMKNPDHIVVLDCPCRASRSSRRSRSLITVWSNGSTMSGVWRVAGREASGHVPPSSAA